MNTALTKLYYASLIVTTLAFATYTVLIGGTHVANGQKIAELEKRSAILAERRVTIEQTISQETSFTQLIQVADATGFVSTQNILQVPSLTQVASR